MPRPGKGRGMELVLLIAAFVLFVIATGWLWTSGSRPLSLVSAGLACWVLVQFVGSL